MTHKTKNIIYWALTGLVAFVFLGSAAGKFSGNEEALKMAAGFGLDASTYTMLGVVEMICLLLFVLPRTGVLGTVLLAAYMGGAIATHLTHGLSPMAPALVLMFTLLVALYRFPELRTRFINATT
jgi:hypothetical protein